MYGSWTENYLKPTSRDGLIQLQVLWNPASMLDTLTGETVKLLQVCTTEGVVQTLGLYNLLLSHSDKGFDVNLETVRGINHMNHQLTPVMS